MSGLNEPSRMEELGSPPSQCDRHWSRPTQQSGQHAMVEQTPNPTTICHAMDIQSEGPEQHAMVDTGSVRLTTPWVSELAASRPTRYAMSKLVYT